MLRRSMSTRPPSGRRHSAQVGEFLLASTTPKLHNSDQTARVTVNASFSHPSWQTSSADQTRAERNTSLQLITVARRWLLSVRTIMKPDTTFTRRRQVPLGNWRRVFQVWITAGVVTVGVAIQIGRAAWRGRVWV